MRLVFAGTPQAALPTLHAIATSPSHELAAVITRPDAPAGRGRHSAASPVADYARQRGIEVLTPPRPSQPEFLDRLQALAPDCIPVVAYGALIPPQALDIPRHGWVNLHFSLLPAWRGAAPVQRSILAGDEIIGATTFLIEQGLDTGPVFAVATQTVPPHATSGDMLEVLAESGAGLMMATLDAIGGGFASPQPQPASGVSLAPRLTPADAQINWTDPALAIDRRIRACSPAPGAWTTWRGQRLKLGVARIDPDHPVLAPGRLDVTADAVWVGTGSQALRLGQVAQAGRSWMEAAPWARGTRPTPDERLGGALEVAAGQGAGEAGKAGDRQEGRR